MEKLKQARFLLRVFIILWIISLAVILALRLMAYQRTGVFEFGSAIYAVVFPGFLALLLYYLQKDKK